MEQVACVAGARMGKGERKFVMRAACEESEEEG